MSVENEIAAKTTKSSRLNHVVLGLDDDVVFPVVVLMFSLKKHASETFLVELGFFEGHLKEQNQEILRLFADAMAIPIRFTKFAYDRMLFVGKRHISPTTFLKFLFADRIPSDFVWLDVDTVALAGWDSIFTALSGVKPETELVVAKKLNPQATGFNAGVLGWPARTRRREWMERVANPRKEDFGVEQDIFNELYAGRLQWISVEFNYVSLWDQLEFDKPKNPKIFHYAGPIKPWFLTENLARRCLRFGCSWSPWLRTRLEMMSSPEIAQLKPQLAELRRSSMTPKNSFTRKLLAFRIIRIAKLAPLDLFIGTVFRGFSLLRLGNPPLFHPFHLRQSR